MGAGAVILCEFRGNWYLSTGISAANGCTLRCGARMPHPAGFKPLPPVGALLYGSVFEIEAITFFPIIRRLEYPLRPVMWHPEREEPILKCYLDNSELTRDLTCYNDLARWNRIYKERKAALWADGWHWSDPREGCEKYLHVDELEKIEGPPPEGPS